MRKAIALSIIVCAAACSNQPSQSDEVSASQSNVPINVTRFHQPGAGSVNSWLLEGSEGIVLIDAQRSMSAGRELVEQIKVLGKPLVAILLTHPHPDHFGGLQAVLNQYPNVPVYASVETIDIMKGDKNGFIAMTKAVMKDDAPDQQPIPTKSVVDGQRLTFGDIELAAKEFGAGEADSATTYYSEPLNAIFAGDIVDNKMTGFVMEGQSAAWLQQIDAAQSEYAARKPAIYAGHGERGDMGLFNSQREWIKTLRSLVSERLADGLSDQEIATISEEMEKRYPDRLPVAAVPALMSENIKAVAKELSERTTP